MVEKVSDDTEQDGKGERDQPQGDGVGGLEEELERVEVVLETFFLQTKRDL